MDKIVKFSRVVTLFVIVSILLTIYAASLYKLQIVDGEEYLETSANSIVTKSTVYASRGDILDRNGTLLVTSRTVYNVVLSRSEILNTEAPNATLLDIVYTAVEHDVSYNDSFPVTMSGPFEYTAMTETQSTRLAKYLEFFDLDPDISASDLIIWLKDHYKIDYTTSLTDARLIIGVRYELELRAIMNIAQYIFAEDVDIEFISLLLERDIPGVSIETSSEREYCTEYASHILGYVGLMDGDEYETYKEQGYSMDAVVGKEGVEKAFEEYLHGTDGTITTTTNAAGAVVDVLTNEEAVSGNNVYLTLDIGLQEVAEEALADIIAQLNASRGEDEAKAEGGAVVAIEVDTGELLTMASYPSYDISSVRELYSQLSTDPTRPLLNRATQGLYNPGSTFKMITALAGLEEQKISRWTTATCTGRYTAYESYQPKCWVYPNSHGTLNVVGAIENSCNYFFFSLADRLGIDPITRVTKDFGFGQKTGVEIYEEAGVVTSPEYKKEELNDSWYAADTLLTAIGQGHNRFTPIQIANYIATIANGGTLYSTTLLNCVKSNDYTKVVYDNQPVVKNESVDNNQGFVSILQEGMRAVATTGTAKSFAHFMVPVAAKTGTVQSDNASVNSGVFVCYAPADDPEIAIAVVVENGNSGSSILSVAEKMMEYYFDDSEDAEVSYFENSLIM